MKGFLVISRRVGERIQIGEDIEIMITDIFVHKEGKKPKVDIAIRAPKEVSITRKGSFYPDGDRNKDRCDRTEES